MKNTKKIVAIGIALIMTGVMLTGCGNGVDHKDYMKDSGSVTASVDKDVEKDSDKKSETADKADEDKKDKAQSETEKKADATENAGKDSKAEDSKKSDTGSSVSNSGNAGNNSNSGSVSKPNTGSGNSNTGNNGNHNGSVNKPSGGNNSNSGNSGNNGNHNGGNKPAEKPSEPEKPAPHICSFDTVVSTNAGNCQTASSTVKKCSCGKTTTVNGDFGSHNMVHHDAQGHDVTDYEYHAICGGCGADFGSGEAGANAALDHTMKDFNDGCVNYSSKRVPVGSHWEETSPAYDECSICGKR